MAIDRPAVIRDELLNTFGYTNVYSGDLTSVDEDEVIVVQDDTGVEPTNLINGGLSSVNYDGIRIVVRGEQHDYGGVRNRARDIMEDLHQHDITGFTSLTKRGGIFPIDRDSDGRPRFEINFLATIKE